MTEQTPTPNIPLLRKAVEWAETEAAKGFETVTDHFGDKYEVPLGAWNQGLWVGQSASCGTAYCIAGYVAVLHDARYDNPLGAGYPVDSDGDVDYEEPCARELAMDLLDLTSSQANGLFDGGNTIEDVRRIAEAIAGETL